MTTVAAIKAVLSADTVQFQKRFAAAEAQLTAFKKHAEETGRRLSAIGKKMSMYFTLPATVAGGLAVRSFARYEQSLTEVAKNADLTNEELESLSDTISDMSVSLGQTNIELAGTAAEIARMGIHGEEAIVRLTETLGKLSRTSDIVSEGAKQDFAKLVGITDTAADSVENLASVITMLGQETKAGEAAIVEMARDIAASTKLYNIAATDAAAFASVARDLGMRVRGTGYAFNRVYRRLNDFSMAARASSKEGERLQEVMGMTAEEIQKLLKSDPAEVFVRFLEGISSVADAEGSLSNVLQDLELDTDRTRQILELLAKKHEDVADRIKRGRGEFEQPSALMGEWQRQTETFMFAWDKMSQQIRVTSQEWGSMLTPVLRGLFALLRSVFAILQGVPAPLKAITLALGGLLAVSGPILLVWGKLRSGTGLLASTFVQYRRTIDRARYAMWGLQESTLGFLALKAALITMVAQASYEFGKWLGKVTGVSDAISELAARLYGLRDAQKDLASAQVLEEYWSRVAMEKRIERLQKTTGATKQLITLLENLQKAGKLTPEQETILAEARKGITSGSPEGAWLKSYEDMLAVQKEILDNSQTLSDVERLNAQIYAEEVELKKQLASVLPESATQFVDVTKESFRNIFNVLTQEGVLWTKELRAQFDQLVTVWGVSVSNRMRSLADALVAPIKEQNRLYALTEKWGGEVASNLMEQERLQKELNQLKRLDIDTTKQQAEIEQRINNLRTERAKSSKTIVESLERANTLFDLEQQFGLDGLASVYIQLEDLFKQWAKIQSSFGGKVPQQFVNVFNKAFKRITGQLTQAMETTAERVYPSALQKGTVEEFRVRVSGGVDDLPKQQLKEQQEANVILGRMLNALNADQIPGFTLR